MKEIEIPGLSIIENVSKSGWIQPRWIKLFSSDF